MKIFYISKLLRKIQRIRIRYPYTNHPPLTYRTSDRPPPDRLSDDCPILINYPDEFILNTKFVQNVSTNTDTPFTCFSDVHDTSDMLPSPPDTLSDNHPELAVHPRMNSHSDHNTLHCVRTPLTLHLSCHAPVCICLLCIYCFFPPLISGRPR